VIVVIAPGILYTWVRRPCVPRIVGNVWRHDRSPDCFPDASRRTPVSPRPGRQEHFLPASVQIEFGPLPGLPQVSSGARLSNPPIVPGKDAFA
jgi:hypothetical protein